MVIITTLQPSAPARSARTVQPTAAIAEARLTPPATGVNCVTGRSMETFGQAGPAAPIRVPIPTLRVTTGEVITALLAVRAAVAATPAASAVRAAAVHLAVAAASVAVAPVEAAVAAVEWEEGDNVKC